VHAVLPRSFVREQKTNNGAARVSVAGGDRAMVRFQFDFDGAESTGNRLKDTRAEVPADVPPARLRASSPLR
jgi:hypothetical protein